MSLKIDHLENYQVTTFYKIDIYSVVKSCLVDESMTINVDHDLTVNCEFNY